MASSSDPRLARLPPERQPAHAGHVAQVLGRAGVPFGLLLVFVAVPGLREGVVGVLTQVSQVAGLVAILYALWM